MTGERPRPLHGPGASAPTASRTALASAFGGSPTTTYAENIGVMGATRVYSTAAYYVAAVVAILLGLCPKFGAIVSATPGGVLGGITVVLYGMIGLVGAKIWVENGVDFGNPVNLVGLAAGIIAGIGGVTLKITDNFSLERHRPRHDPGDRLLPPGQRPRRGRRRHDDPRRSVARRRRRGLDDRATGRTRPGVDVKPAPFAYVRPQGLQHALEALAADPGAKVLAGGQSLVPLLSMRLAAPVDAGRHQRPARPRPRPRGRRRGPGRRAGPARRRARLGRRTPGAAAGLAGAGPRRPRRRSATAAPPSARSCTPTPRPRCRWCWRCSAGSVTVASAARHAARSRPPSCSPARWSRRCATTRSPLEAFFPALAAGRGRRVRGDRATARRLRPVRRRRPSCASTATAVVSARVGYLSVCDVPTVVDLTDALAATPTSAAADAGAGAQLDPADDIHATAAYRAQLVRVLTARVLRAAYDDARRRAATRDRGAARRPADRQRRRRTTCGCRRGGCCPTPCATTSA